MATNTAALQSVTKWRDEGHAHAWISFRMRDTADTTGSAGNLLERNTNCTLSDGDWTAAANQLSQRTGLSFQ